MRRSVYELLSNSLRASLRSVLGVNDGEQSSRYECCATSKTRPLLRLFKLLEQLLGDESKVPSRPRACHVKLVSWAWFELAQGICVEGLDVGSAEDDADVVIVIRTFRSPPVLREAAVLVVLLVEELYNRGVAVESQNNLRITLESNCGLSALMRND